MKTPKRILDLATSLVLAAQEQNVLAEVCTEIEKLDDVFARVPSARIDLSETAVDETVRLTAVKDLTSSFHPLVGAVVSQLAKSGEFGHWETFVQVVKETAERVGHHLVTAICAEELSETQMTHARESLENILKGSVSLTSRIDTSVLGGVRFEGIGWDIDQSVRGSLSRLQQAFHSS